MQTDSLHHHVFAITAAGITTGSHLVTGSGSALHVIPGMIETAINLKSFGLKALARDTGEVKPPEKPSVDDRTAMCLRSMVSVNEEKDLRYSQEAPKLA